MFELLFIYKLRNFRSNCSKIVSGDVSEEKSQQFFFVSDGGGWCCLSALNKELIN